MVKMWHLFIFLKLFCDQPVRSFQPLRFCPLDSKNVFVLVLTHLEPELELFEVGMLEVWIMVLQIIITIIANVIKFNIILST